MKIFSNNKVYVQNNDLAYFMRGVEGMPVPSSIIDKIFGQVFIVTDNNRYDFIEFSKPEEVEFFRNCDWMIDYNFFDEMTEDEIIAYGCQINDERNYIAHQFNELSEKEREKKYMEVSTQIELLEFKMWSVRDVLWHKQGHLSFALPEGIVGNYLSNSSKQETSNNDYNLGKEKIIQKVIRRIRKRNYK